MSRELDEQIALALGWKGVGFACMMGPYEDLYYKSYTNDGYDVVPHFSADPDATYLLEDEIERRGLIEDYISALDKLVTYPSDLGWQGYRWGILRATPEQRVRAFLAALNDPARS